MFSNRGSSTMSRTSILVAFAVAFALPLACLSLPVGSSRGDWLIGARADGSESVTLSFAIKQRNSDVLTERFEAVSDPRHADYGKFFTREELIALVSSNDDDVAAVTNWLVSSGVAQSDIELTGSRDILRAKVSASLAETLLGVNIHVFTHAQRGIEILRATQAPLLPIDVRSVVDFVSGLNHFPVVRNLREHNAINAESNITPAFLRKLYGITDIASGKTNSSQALAEFQGQSYSVSDLSKFESTNSIPSQTVRKVTGAGAGSAQIEGNLDIQYILVAGQNVATDYWLEDGFDFDLVAWIAKVEATNDSPLVWSVSYGEDLSEVTADYAQRLDKEFQKLGLLGVSVIFASGDSGVYSRTGGTSRFHPSFPASLPSVTAVGATQLDGGVEKQGVNWSGGGFSLSNYFARAQSASYQNAAVAAYFNEQKSTLPPATYYDTNGRGFPDVSAQGVNYAIIEDGSVELVSGTSASAPLFAGIIGLLNDLRLQGGKQPLGFLNPFLYQNPQAFNDITQGTNNNGEKYGFNAAAGWDPVTGLGTPNYPKLKDAALKA